MIFNAGTRSYLFVNLDTWANDYVVRANAQQSKYSVFEVTVKLAADDRTVIGICGTDTPNSHVFVSWDKVRPRRHFRDPRLR